MSVETSSGTTFRLTYGAESGGATAVGFDRSTLDPALVSLAIARGASVRPGAAVVAVTREDDRRTASLRYRDGTGEHELRSTVVVGADGIRSLVARSMGVTRPARISPRTGLTYHIADPRPAETRDARMRVLVDGYVGIAPVAGGRINVGIVLGREWRGALARHGAVGVAAGIIAGFGPSANDPTDWRSGPPIDTIAGASPIGHRVTSRAGRGWVLVGDAAGFLDPFTGEGLHRALRSAELAAEAVNAHLSGRPGALEAYDRAMQRRFGSKDVVSALVQAFLARPAVFEYAARRLASRAHVRATMGLVMGDLVPASRGLDPRYLAALLVP